MKTAGGKDTNGTKIGKKPETEQQGRSTQRARTNFGRPPTKAGDTNILIGIWKTYVAASTSKDATQCHLPRSAPNK